MNVTIELQNASSIKDIPLRRQFRHWASSTLQETAADAGKLELSIRIIDESESAELNSHYRHKEGATNILSFPVPEEFSAGNLLGDLAICAPVVRREAGQQDKHEDAHWAHLIVHGVLHLQGFDHENETDAAEMEALEIKILQQLGVANPYQAT